MNERKELIARLRLDYTASKLALSLMKQAADALQSQAERINDLETEAEQLRKGHFDTSEANAALRSKLKGITICTVKRAQKIKPEAKPPAGMMNVLLAILVLYLF